MGLRDLKKKIDDGLGGLEADVRKGVGDFKGSVEGSVDSVKGAGRLATKDGRAQASLERQQQQFLAREGREAAAAKAVQAADRGDIRAEEAAINEIWAFEGGQQLLTELSNSGQLRRGGFIGSVGPETDRIWLWRDRILSGEGLYLVDANTKASVDQAGNLSMAYRHTVARSLLWSSSWQKRETADSRQLFFMIEHPEWAKVVEVPPNFSHQVRQMAAALNSAASAKAISDSMSAPTPAVEPPPVEAPPVEAPPVDPLDRIKKLVELRDAGALTDEEFAEQKAKILNA